MFPSLSPVSAEIMNDAATSLLNFLDLAGATVKATLDKPRCCRRKVNHRRFLQKQFLRLCGGSSFSNRSSSGKVEAKGERKRANSSGSKRYLAAQTSASKGRSSLVKRRSSPQVEEVYADRGEVLSPCSDRSSTCSLSNASELDQQHVGDVRKWRTCSFQPGRWIDDQTQLRSPTSFSDGSTEDVFSPASASSASDGLSVSGESLDSLPCSPLGVTEAANLLTKGLSNSSYPPRLHHLEQDDLLSIARTQQPRVSMNPHRGSLHVSSYSFGHFGSAHTCSGPRQYSHDSTLSTSPGRLCTQPSTSSMYGTLPNRTTAAAVDYRCSCPQVAGGGDWRMANCFWSSQ